MAQATVIGHGKDQVYLYYYPAYRMLRLQQDHYDWPCKIGWTRGQASHRVLQQTHTSNPEKPVLGLVINSDDGYRLEQALHAILRLYHKEIRQATGDEWFLTTPAEVEQLCRMLRLA